MSLQNQFHDPLIHQVCYSYLFLTVSSNALLSNNYGLPQARVYEECLSNFHVECMVDILSMLVDGRTASSTLIVDTRSGQNYFFAQEKIKFAAYSLVERVVMVYPNLLRDYYNTDKSPDGLYCHTHVSIDLVGFQYLLLTKLNYQKIYDKLYSQLLLVENTKHLAFSLV
jgi:hypothetical protein